MMNPFRKHHKSRYRSFSLVEVLVVLGLVATTMVAATQITVSALIKIKQNEIDDYVNGLMVKVLEAAKSPQPLTIDNGASGLATFQGSYILVIPEATATQPTVSPSFKQQSLTPDPIQPTTCNSSSPNYVSIPNLGTYVPPAVCIQALVVQLTGINATPIYQITVRAVYNLSSGPVSRELLGYRRTDPISAVAPP